MNKAEVRNKIDGLGPNPRALRVPRARAELLLLLSPNLAALLRVLIDRIGSSP